MPPKGLPVHLCPNQGVLCEVLMLHEFGGSSQELFFLKVLGLGKGWVLELQMTEIHS